MPLVSFHLEDGTPRLDCLQYEAKQPANRGRGSFAPLRVLIYEDGQGKTCVEYDRPSSLFGQFENDRIAPTAAMLDKKLEALVAEAFK